MIYKRHYVQFNDLVFDQYDMISEDDTDVSFKTNSTSYTYKHGSYMPFKRPCVLAESTTVSLTLYLRMKKIPCEKRQFYRSFVISELTKHGKLWAIQNNTLVWAYATLTNYSEQSSSRTDELEIDVDFELPEGIFHKANKLKTFMQPFDICELMDCYGYKEIKPCCDCGDCDVVTGANDCCCDDVTKEMALCYVGDLETLYSCSNPYHIVYNCERAEMFFDNIGQRLCGKCGIITGQLYSDTDLPTNDIRITLTGNVVNPIITINGNTNYIAASTDCELILHPDGSATIGCDTLDLSSWVVPSGMEFGWTVHPGNNTVVINTGDCCGTVCAYIDVDSITI